MCAFQFTRRFFSAIQCALTFALCALVVSCSSKNPAEKVALSPPSIKGFSVSGEIRPEYAEGFAFFTLVDSASGKSGAEEFTFLQTPYESYLCLKEGQTAPKNLPSGVTLLTLPLRKIYSASLAAVPLLDSCGALDSVAFTSTALQNWYLPSVISRINDGRIIYCGKYSSPDYELLLSKKPDSVIESTMIFHASKTKEKLESLGFPVIIDRSSYEKDPLGRLEWVKVWGKLSGFESEADDFFERQKSIVKNLSMPAVKDKKVAFFYINSNNLPVIRGKDDYIPRMIKIAGGRYAFDRLSTKYKASSPSVTVSMEALYSAARDADVIIYNSSITAPLSSIGELLLKCPLLEKSPAVIQGQVWSAGKNVYESIADTALLLRDINLILSAPDTCSLSASESDSPETKFLRRLK